LGFLKAIFTALVIKVYFSKSRAGFQWLVKTSFAHYTFEGSIISLYGNVGGENRTSLNCSSEPETRNFTEFIETINQNVTMECESE